ncbi:hypothetical protein OROMI_009838 [Orobanche minor]
MEKPTAAAGFPTATCDLSRRRWGFATAKEQVDGLTAGFRIVPYDSGDDISLYKKGLQN